jgi:glycerophosphoryl diester phosphodiesterase
MIIISHRGLGFGKEENSLESYEEALKKGFSIEVDVQKSIYNELVVSHDTSLKRLRGIDKNITEMSFDELSELGIPSFESVLDCFKNYSNENQLIAIHLKDELQGNIIELVLKAIKKKEIEERVFLFDLTTNGLKHAKQINPRVKIGLSLGERRYTGTIYLWGDIKDNLEMDVIWWDEWNSGLYNQENFDKIEKPVYVISPELHKSHNHPKSSNLEDIKSVWKDLIELDVDGICTDYPLELKNFLENNGN